MWLELSLLLLIICYGLHLRAFSYWKRRGIFQLDGSFIFGNIKDIFFAKIALHTYIWENVYKKHKQKKLVGFYGFYRPFLVVTDPDVIKEIIIKEFSSFGDSSFTVDDKLDPVLGANPFAISNIEKWKEARGLHVPLFTPAKLKLLPELMCQFAPNMIKYLKENGKKAVKVKDITDFLTVDTVNSYSFVNEPTAFIDPENPFMKYARDFFTKESVFVANGYFFYPELLKILKLRGMTKESVEFFISFCTKMMDFRRKSPSDRPDFFGHMAKINEKRKQEGKPIFTDEEIGIHCMSNYLDSFFTTSSSLGSFVIELSKNLDVQEKLRKEILVVGNKMEDFDYEKVNSITFLHMALLESLRLHSPVPVSGRKCTKTCEIEGKKIEAGTKIFLPYFAFHMDPEYFPEPDKYKPERYLSEDSYTKMALLPFGDGPRVCLGQKYAQMVMKVGIIYMLLHFRILPEKETEDKSKKNEDLDQPFIFFTGFETVIFEPLL